VKPYEGSVHDFTIVKEENWKFPQGISVYQDTGFQGHCPENVTIKQPTKKPKGKELTPEQKEYNTEVSKVRVKVEHTIGRVKIFRIVKETLRNWKQEFKDLVMQICCGLANFKNAIKI
jgi:hypothetical protein